MHDRPPPLIYPAQIDDYHPYCARNKNKEYPPDEGGFISLLCCYVSSATWNRAGSDIYHLPPDACPMETAPQPLSAERFFHLITIRFVHLRSNGSNLFHFHQRLQASCNQSPRSISSDPTTLVHDRSCMSSAILPLLFPFDLIHPTATRLSSDTLTSLCSFNLAHPAAHAPRTLLPISHSRRKVVDSIRIVIVRPLNRNTKKHGQKRKDTT